jgi:serine/threonine protein kinase
VTNRRIDVAIALEVGSKLGPYRLMRLLGEGGMGMVFVAQHTILGHEVALKCMRPEYAQRQPKARERFFREAKLAFSLRETNRDRIVKVTHVDDVGGVPYLIMELLKGKSLHDYLTDHHVPDLSFTLKLALHVGEGLDIAHRAGLIHQDIKPHNLWIEEFPGGDWRCKILDFGLARAVDVDDGITTTGFIQGTYRFMSPEQWNGKGVDHQSDPFSLGVVRYRLMSGEYPFQGTTQHELLFQICGEEPKPLQELCADLSPQLALLIDRLLAKKKVDRYETVQKFIEELGTIVATPKTDVHVAPVQIIPRVEEERERVERLKQPLGCTGPNGADAATVKRLQTNWAEALGLPVETSVDLGDGVKMDFVPTPPGRFWMGSTEADIDLVMKLFPDSKREWFIDEMPQHLVTITKPFYLGRSAVTRGQFARFVRAKSYVTEAERADGG